MLNKNKGFTFIEVVASVFVITLVVAGVFTVIQSTIAHRSLAVSQLQAAYLAQEGIELARNQRDNNWLSSLDWDFDLINVDELLDSRLARFTRDIAIGSGGDEELFVTVTVSWEEKGTAHSFIVQAKLYDWYEE